MRHTRVLSSAKKNTRNQHFLVFLIFIFFNVALLTWKDVSESVGVFVAMKTGNSIG